MAIELKVPPAGESITEATVGEWLVEEGAFVEVDDGVVLLETDKASMELPAPVSGIVTKILKQQDETVAVGEVIGYMEERDADDAGSGKDAEATAKKSDEATEEDTDESRQKAADVGAASDDSGADDEGQAIEARVMPAARRALHDAGIDASKVEGSGPGGRVLKEDVERYLAEHAKQDAKAEGKAPEKAPEKPQPKPEAKGAAPAASKSQPQKEAPTKADTAKADTTKADTTKALGPPSGPRQEEAVRMTRLRRLIAER
ncbi:MAG: E3 binding domain-containing protein, partial [Acidobacteria bacterium]|nr:E3 binding domain-containing protein [Acidobacteriota bacterium]